MAHRIRHSTLLKEKEVVWTALRPIYDGLMNLIARQGITRVLNGTDEIRLLPKFRAIPESYEPDVWAAIMKEVRPGSTIVDVGAHIGLYTIGFATRIGPEGTVHAFEPVPTTRRDLIRNLGLNALLDRVEVIDAVASNVDGTVPFEASDTSEAHVDDAGDELIRSVRLDSLFRGRHIDLVKVDVEGYEGIVIEGASGLIEDERLRPRVIVIETHPYGWARYGTHGSAMLQQLDRAGYVLDNLGVQDALGLHDRGWIIARQSMSVPNERN